MNSDSTTKLKKEVDRPGILSAYGNTPLIEITSLSAATGCRILAKCEHLNPQGDASGRIALNILEDGEKRGAIRRGDTLLEEDLVEGSAIRDVALLKGYEIDQDGVKHVD